MTDCLFRIATCKTRGMRKMQEDACGFRSLGDSSQTGSGAQASSDRFVLVLADGMGGHAGGATASTTACSVFLEEYVRSNEPIRVRLGTALGKCNSALNEIVDREPELAGMGCTLVGVSLEGGRLQWVSVGDSLLYLIRRDRSIRRLNSDHSMWPVLQQMVLSGEISAADAEQHPHRHALRSALTGEPIPQVDLPEEDCEIGPGDWIIVGSDGLLTLSESQIAETLDRNSKMGPEGVAKALIDAIAMEHRPNQDNATVIVANASSIAGDTEELVPSDGVAGADSRTAETVRLVSSDRAEPVLRAWSRLRHALELGLAAANGAVPALNRWPWLRFTLASITAVAAFLLYFLTLVQHSATSTSYQPARQDNAPQAGRTAVAAAVVNNPQGRWFLPGAGKTESFKDCPVCPEMVVVPAGSFTMGSSESEPERENRQKDTEGPLHEVTIGEPFAVGRFAVTRDEFEAFVKDSSRRMDGGCDVRTGGDWRIDSARSYRSPGFEQTGSHPVVCVNWNDAKAYVAWLSRKTGKNYRLLSEAEREYVARAGTKTAFWWGPSITLAQANYSGDYSSSSYPYEGDGQIGEHLQKTAPVKSFQPNPWGLYQVHGNIWEWVEDCWNETYNGAPSDGAAWTAGDCGSRVIRGGSWDNPSRALRAAQRHRFFTAHRDYHLGFRVARTLEPIRF